MSVYGQTRTSRTRVGRHLADSRYSGDGHDWLIFVELYERDARCRNPGGNGRSLWEDKARSKLGRAMEKCFKLLSTLPGSMWCAVEKCQIRPAGRNKAMLSSRCERCFEQRFWSSKTRRKYRWCENLFTNTGLPNVSVYTVYCDSSRCIRTLLKPVLASASCSHQLVIDLEPSVKSAKASTRFIRVQARPTDHSDSLHYCRGEVEVQRSSLPPFDRPHQPHFTSYLPPCLITYSHLADHSIDRLPFGSIQPPYL